MLLIYLGHICSNLVYKIRLKQIQILVSWDYITLLEAAILLKGL